MVKRLASLTLIVLAALVPVMAEDPPPLAAAQEPGTGPYTEEVRLGRGMVRSVAWSPDGGIIAVGGVLGIWLYTPDLQDIGLLTGHTKAVYGLAFSPDGTRLASASHDQTVRIWDIAAQKELVRLEGHTDLVVTVVWSPDGQTLASGGYDNTIRLWSAETGEAVGVLEGHSGWVNQVAFSPDGALLASADRMGQVIIWDMATREMHSAFKSSHTIPDRVSWDPARDTLSIVWNAGPSGIHEVWEWKTGHLFDSLKGPFPPFESLNPSGSLIAAVDWDESVQVWDAATGESLSIQPQHTDWITSLAWSAEGMKITSAGSDRKVRTWDAATGTLLEITDGQMEAGPVTANSPDSTKTARAGDDGTTITDTAAGQVIAFLPGPANAVSWSPDGARLAVALRNGTIKIWGEG